MFLLLFFLLLVVVPTVRLETTVLNYLQSVPLNLNLNAVTEKHSNLLPPGCVCVNGFVRRV